MLTDRDITIRCVAKNLDPDKAPVSEVMTTPVQTVDEHTPIGEAVTRMANAGTRRLLVTGGVEGVVGVLSMDDVLGLVVEQTGAIGRLLERQKPLIPA
jgi:CBS domain-containing protein